MLQPGLADVEPVAKAGEEGVRPAVGGGEQGRQPADVNG